MTDNIRLLDDNYEITEPPYALPAEVRSATMIASEISMGYAPVNVVDDVGKSYTLAHKIHLF
ncbi:hypothetical protein CCP3SC1_200024 [Gammaproteobacteria bacterium]